MIQALPLTIEGALLKEVQLYVDQPEQVTEFALRKLERQVDNLAKADAAAANTIRAAIAAFRWDVEGVKHWTDKALCLNRSYNTLINGANNSLLVADIRGAAELALESMEYVSGDADAALQACHALMHDAQFDEALLLSEKFSRSSDGLEAVALHAESALACIQRIGLDQDEVRRQVELGALVAQEHQVRIIGTEAYGVDDFEDGERFVTELCFLGDIHKEIALDKALVEKFLDDPSWDPMKLSVQFHYTTEDELQSI